MERLSSADRPPSEQDSDIPFERRESLRERIEVSLMQLDQVIEADAHSKDSADGTIHARQRDELQEISSIAEGFLHPHTLIENQELAKIPEIFISYSSDDRDIASAFHHGLRRNGTSVFLTDKQQKINRHNLIQDCRMAQERLE